MCNVIHHTALAVVFCNVLQSTGAEEVGVETFAATKLNGMEAVRKIRVRMKEEERQQDIGPGKARQSQVVAGSS